MTRAEEAALKAYPADSWKKGLVAEHIVDLRCRKAYQEGYEQAEKDLARWIPVEESLPEMDEEVIVLRDILVKDGIKVGFGMIAFGHIVDKEKCIDYNGWNISGVRYWMPLPKTPE